MAWETKINLHYYIIAISGIFIMTSVHVDMYTNVHEHYYMYYCIEDKSLWLLAVYLKLHVYMYCICTCIHNIIHVNYCNICGEFTTYNKNVTIDTFSF